MYVIETSEREDPKNQLCLRNKFFLFFSKIKKKFSKANPPRFALGPTISEIIQVEHYQTALNSKQFFYFYLS